MCVVSEWVCDSMTFWQELGQQFNVPHPLRHQLAVTLALYRLCADEPEQQPGARASERDRATQV